MTAPIVTQYEPRSPLLFPQADLERRAQMIREVILLGGPRRNGQLWERIAEGGTR
jgi:hypothetical protein